MGLGNAVNTGFANNGILTIMTYYGEGTALYQFLAYLIGILVAFLGAAILTYFVGFEDMEKKAESEESIKIEKEVFGSHLRLKVKQ